MCNKMEHMISRGLSLFALVTVSACSSPSSGTPSEGGSSSAGPGSGGNGSGASAGSPADGGGGGGTDACVIVPDPAGECPSTLTPDAPPKLDTGVVSGRVVDPSGTPLAGIALQVCGLDTCLYGTSSADGTFAVQGAELEKPILKWGDGRTAARRGLSITEKDPSVGDLITDALPAGVGLFSAGASLTSSGVTATLDATVDNLAFNIIENGECESENQFRAVSLPSDDSTLEFGLAPLYTTVCPGITFSVVNTKAWPAESEVRWEVYSFDIEQTHYPYGEWAEFGTGKVSTDSSTIEMDAGEMNVVGNLRIVRAL